jgi:hypothetical protein
MMMLNDKKDAKLMLVKECLTGSKFLENLQTLN